MRSARDQDVVVIVHRRVLGAASQRVETPVDALAVRVAGRHLYDRVSHGYVHVGASGSSAVFDRVIQAYEAAYAVPGEGAAREPVDAASARAGLGHDFIDDLASAVERAFDIHVIQADDVGGDCAIRVAGRRVILVGTTPNWFFRNWSIAHELGHILRGDLEETAFVSAPTASARVAERAANAFAAELLLPRAELAALDWAAMRERELADLVWRSGVSTTALAQRLTSLKLEVQPTVHRLLSVKTAAFVRRGSILGGEPQLRSLRAAQSAAMRLPVELVGAHLSGVAAGSMDPSSLEWMLGSEPAG